MTLTPSTVRLDLKCGKGAIPPGKKCHKGLTAKKGRPNSPSTASQQRALSKLGKTTSLSGKQVITLGAIAAYGALTAAGLYQIRNVRRAYAQKFDPAQRYTPFKDTIGSPESVLKGMTTTSKGGAPSLFGDVKFGTYESKNIVVKTLGTKGPMGAFQVDMMAAQGIVSAKTAKALKNAQSSLQVNEVQAAKLAGELGFGPKLVAAGDNTLITEVARGRPLSSQDRLLRNAPKLQEELRVNPKKAISKLIALRWKGSELSADHKSKVLDNLARMHTAGISHNDLHPGNIFIHGKGAQFIDFGTSERGGASVAAEFVRMMNSPRFGLAQQAGMGYNLRTVNPKEYAVAEKALRLAIGKRVGSLTSTDIYKALEKNKDKSTLEAELQQIVDNFYTQRANRLRSDSMNLTPTTAMNLTPTTVRFDLKCGKGSISPGEKCTKGSAGPAAPNKKRVGMKGGAKIRGLKTAAKIAGAAALIGGAAYLQQTARRHTLERRSLASPASAAGAAFLAERVNNNMSPQAVNNLRARAVANARARAWAKRDSIWAEGFQP